MFVSVWTDRFPNFGNHTTNRVESQQSKLKLYLDSNQATLQIFLSDIHQLIHSQHTSIKASFQQSKTVVKHRYNEPQFRKLHGFVSLHALELIFKEFERLKDPGLVSGNYDDICCDDDVQMFTDNFKKQPRSVKSNFLRKLREIFVPWTTQICEPTVHTTTRGRPSLKSKVVKKSHVEPPKQEPHRHSCPDVSTFVEFDVLANNEQARHRSYFNPKKYVHPYINQFLSFFHPYIMQVEDVKGDGNCGFRAIAVWLGRHEDEWPSVRYDLMEELIIYNVILHSLTTTGSLTFFPFRSSPPPWYEHVAFTIGYVNDNHFVKIPLAEGHAIPRIIPNWFRFIYQCATAWATPYMTRINKYEQQLSGNRTANPTASFISVD
ncbi:hypothetical protein OSB04_017095 [Centaurea solstitialis]|uniref:OTU domain-containing protein n=1 Tax=Centaurea solstitialis TaxID=347529 RepID=A0AA38T293_9ASTR|nr:hypothetical protein OSB04_017095 [Centaurea solstitialis]